MTEGEIVEYTVNRNRRLYAEILFFFDNGDVMILPSGVGVTRRISAEKLRPTGQRTAYRRRRKICPKCGYSGVEIGTLGLENPVFTCYVCQWVVPESWTPPVVVPKTRKKKGEKAKEINTNYQDY